MEQSAVTVSVGPQVPFFMEHRWGQRLPCRAMARLVAAGTTSSGQVRDVSLSGAFIETTLDLPVDARVTVAVLGNESATHAVELTASVVRITRDGIGVEWCEAPVRPICAELGCTKRCAELKTWSPASRPVTQT